MVKLATPISNLFEDDLTREEILKKSHCLECREETLRSSELKQYLFHFDKDILHPWDEAQRKHLDAAFSLKKELKLISFHMATACADPVLKQKMFYTGGREFSRQGMLKNARANTMWLKDSIGNKNIKIAVENNNYYPTPAYRYVTDADFITQVIAENQLLFLFDLAHAKITAHNKNKSYRDYTARLPMQNLVQIHISKHGIDNEGLAYDAHEFPGDDIFEEVKTITSRFTPEYLTIEYYKDKEKLIRALKQYGRLCQRE